MKTLIATTAAAVLLACPVTAGQNCAPHDLVVKRLAEKYGETRRSMGLGANNAVVEVFASDTSGSWTITVTSARGITCLVASGQAFEEFLELLPTEGDPA